MEVVSKDLEYIYNSTKQLRSKFLNSSFLITGCGGFLGFYTLNFLLKYSKELKIKEVVGIDNYLISKPKWLRKLENDFPENFKFIEMDISSFNEEKNDIFLKDYIIHAASVASPHFYRKFPLETVDSNIWGLRNILDAIKLSQPKGILFYSSSEIYGDPPEYEIPTDEEFNGNVSCIGPRSCYDESKRFGETLCWIYSKKYNLPITIARPFNNFGPGMNLNDRRLPADFAKSVLENKNIEILSDGKPTRTFCYVTDAIVGYFKCLFHSEYNYFNIGNDKPEVSVKEMAEIYIKVARDVLGFKLKSSFKSSDDDDYLVNNPNRRCPNITKARKILDFNPSISLEEGVKKYISFLREGNLN